MWAFWRRFVEITVALFPFALAFARDRRRFLFIGRRRSMTATDHRNRANNLRDRMLDLGPAFIKIGQVLSTRPDIVPDQYAEALGTLQDEVPEDIGTDPHRVIDEEGLTEYLDPNTFEPVAGGSLAYVYRTTFGGEPVAVKVQRPGVRERVATDLDVIRTLLPLIARLVPHRYEYSIRNLADDFEAVIGEELDFEREARMMQSIAENFEADETIRIPAVYQEATTTRVLTMEFVEATPIAHAPEDEEISLPPEELANRIVHTYFRMGLDHGTFHADPHPGNLAVDAEDRLVIFDFGMSRRLDPSIQHHLLELYRALAKQDPDQLTASLIDLGALEPHVNRGEVNEVLGLLIETLRAEPSVDWVEMMRELIAALRQFPFRIPPDMMLLIRVGTVSEGVCRDLDPDFDFVAAAREYLIATGHMEGGLREIWSDVNTELERGSWSLLRTPRKLEQTLDRVRQDQVIVTSRIDPTGIRRGGRIVGLAILAGSLFVSSAVLFDPFPTASLVSAILGVLLLVIFFQSTRVRDE